MNAHRTRGGAPEAQQGGRAQVRHHACPTDAPRVRSDRTRRLRYGVVACLVVAPVLQNNGIVATTAAAAATVSPARVVAMDGPPPGGVPGVRVPTIKWSDAGDGYQQATAAVPYDYARPRGARFRLHMVRLPATDPAHKKGTLFVNFGGPGGPAASTVRQIGRFLFLPRVLARYDLVGVDPRGTGQSQPVRCTASTQEQQSMPYATEGKFPVTRAQEVQAIAQVRRFARKCRARNGDLLNHVGTLQFARDLDVLRAALGDRRINLYGLSYGSFLGQVVANTFPTRIGSLVLDGVVDPSWASGPRGSISWTRANADLGGWQTLRRFFRLCAQAGPQRCAFAAGGDPQRKYAKLAARLRATPLMFPGPGQPPVSLGYSELVGVTTAGLYAGFAWPILAQFLQAAHIGDADTVAKIFAEIVPPGYNSYYDANTAITCGDTDNPRDPHRYGQVGRRQDATVAPYFGSLRAYQALNCAPWRGRATERYVGPWTARTANPVLIIGNRYDPATPYRNAVTVHHLLPNSSLITVNGVGHGALFTSCVAEATARYLLTGATPPAGAVCRQDTEPFDPVSAAKAGSRALNSPQGLAGFTRPLPMAGSRATS